MGSTLVLDNQNVTNEDNDLIFENIEVNKNVNSATLDHIVNKLFDSLNLPEDMEKLLE
ncbi:MAG: hypothetical protein KBA66_11080 [Leptospiraceae bacterium]|nr:hypothetical protein [Leptospiraceae bacterium]